MNWPFILELRENFPVIVLLMLSIDQINSTPVPIRRTFVNQLGYLHRTAQEYAVQSVCMLPAPNWRALQVGFMMELRKVA